MSLVLLQAIMYYFWLWCTSLIAAACILYACKRFNSKASLPNYRSKSLRRSEGLNKNKTKARQHGSEQAASELNMLKELYFKLHNLEHFYDSILPTVAPKLWAMMSEAIDHEVQRKGGGILDIETYSRQRLEQFLQVEYDACMCRWEKYNLRRQAGGNRKLFVDRKDASNSIRRLAPLKLVDGAWLAHIGKISTPLALRSVTQNAWQILSEELGDGDLRKNHVRIYSELVHETSGVFLEPHSPLFIDQCISDIHVWKAAVAQQLLSILPDKFLPEILGFNLHFESVAFETLITSRELEELGYSPLYFLLHVSIDNPHSGHSAIALETVARYLEFIQRESGTKELQLAWNRVRAGYLLSQHLNTEVSETRRFLATGLNPCEEAVIQVVTGKARAAQKIHCGSRVRVGGHSINHWLDEERLRERTWQSRFLQALSNTGSLVRKGRSADSKLVKEISWGGKMFGSFTDLEVIVIKQWIDALPWKHGESYWSFTGLCADEVAYDPRTDNQCWINAFYRKTPLIEQSLRESNDSIFPFNTNIDSMMAKQSPNLSKMLPLWFAGLGLLENFVTIPSKVANTRSCAILRVLRAQHGFGNETGGVAGLDEALRTDRVDLVDIGLDWVDKAGLQKPELVDAVLRDPDAAFAREMVTLAVRPEGYADVLVGLSCAFAELHLAMVPVVSPSLQDALQQIAMREQRGLEGWLVDLRGNSADSSMVCKAYSVGRRVIASCFD